MTRNEFPNTGQAFSGYEAAKAFCEGKGYSIGVKQRSDPIGLLDGDYEIAKWRNLSPQDRADLDGVISFVGGPDCGPRRGTAVVEIY